MDKGKSRKFFWWSIVHLFIGYLVGVDVIFPTVLGILPLFLGLFHTIANNNRNNEAAQWAAYYVGCEVLLRITDANLTYEFGKYGTVILLIVGTLVESGKKRNNLFLVYFFLLLPSIIVTEFEGFKEARTSLLFVLSGPLCLAISALYFYERSISVEDFRSILFQVLLPILSLAAYLSIYTPSIEDLTFFHEGNPAASGGFGPNQVASLLGLGIFLIGSMIMLKWFQTGSSILYLGFLFLVSFRALLTFARGGVIGGFLALFSFLTILLLGKGFKTYRNYVFLSLIVVIVLLYYVWSYVDEATGGMLSYRYTGLDYYSESVEGDITTGRLMLLELELERFFSYPVFGIGPGMGKYYNLLDIGTLYSAHSEFSRMLSEHGIFGFFALLILIIIPTKHFLKLPNSPGKAVKLGFLVLALFTMLHSAMRLAFPGFLFGLSLATLVFDNHENSVHRK